MTNPSLVPTGAHVKVVLDADNGSVKALSEVFKIPIGCTSSNPFGVLTAAEIACPSVGNESVYEARFVHTESASDVALYVLLDESKAILMAGTPGPNNCAVGPRFRP